MVPCIFGNIDNLVPFQDFNTMTSVWFLPPVIIGLMASIINLSRRSALLNLVALAIQYMAVFFLMTDLRTIGLAFVKLLVGLAAVSLLFISLSSINKIDIRFKFHYPSVSEAFRATSGLVMITIILLFLPDIKAIIFPAINDLLLLMSFCLMIIGLIQIGTSQKPLFIFIGLLTFISGFELLYAALEFSVLLESIFAGVNLGLALVASYCLIKDAEEELP